MTYEELGMRRIPAPLAAEAMGVSNKSIHLWFAADELQGRHTGSGRLWVTIASCRALLRKRRGDGSAAEADFERFIQENELPEEPRSFAHVGIGAAALEKEAVLC